ncbi:hypothetical protein [Acetomicrobium sp.]|nr:hypothetical protein [Acetomicrobium sp.]
MIAQLAKRLKKPDNNLERQLIGKSVSMSLKWLEHKVARSMR